MSLEAEGRDSLADCASDSMYGSRECRGSASEILDVLRNLGTGGLNELRA
jgi:hypothetical protein